MRSLMIFALMVGALVSVALGASKVTTNKFRLEGERLVVTSQINAAATATVLGLDSDDSSSKHAMVHRWIVNGQEVDVLVRVQHARGSLHIDLVADKSIAALVTTVSNLSLTAIGHPSPSKDKIDAQAMVAAGGS